MASIDNLSNVISCPYCAKKYFPSQVFIPKSFLGTAVAIDDNTYYGADMDLNETYTCDGCNNLFEVTAKVSFISRQSKVKNFEDSF